MFFKKSLEKERELYEKKQRKRLIRFRKIKTSLPDWFKIAASECYNNTAFFYKIYGSLSETMNDHPTYRHLKGASINRGKYYSSGDVTHLTNILSYVIYEFFIPLHHNTAIIVGKDVERDFNKIEVPQTYFKNFFDKCLERHIEADNIYGNLDRFIRKNPKFEHMEDGWLRNRVEYHQYPHEEPLVDLANYTIYELRSPLHKILH